jgi:hypothetical protein
MPIPPVTEFEGQLPNEGEPASFPARAEALFDWLVGQGMPTFNAAIAAVNLALNDNGTVLDTAGKAIALTTNAGTLVETAGTGNAYTITPAVSIPAYEDGQTFMIRPNRSNTGAVTLKVGARAAVPVRKLNADGTTFAELVPNDWRPGEIHIVGYRGGQFELLTVPLNRFVRSDASQAITAPWTFSETATFDDILAAILTAADVVLSKNGPAITWDDTTGTPSTHRIVDARYNDGVWSLDVRNAAGVFLQRVLQITMNAAGALAWSLNVGGTPRLVVTSGGAAVTGNLSVTGAFQAGGGSTSLLGVVHANTDACDLGRPHSSPIDGALNGFRWRNIFLVNAPNVSSDVSDKDEIEPWTEQELRAGVRLRSVKFRRKSSDTRHAGYIAQEIVAAFVAEGFDADHPLRIGLLSRDESGIYGVDVDAVNAFRIDALAAA